MERRDRDRYEHHDYDNEYGRYKGYNRDDEHYHSAKNLTDEFERDYQHERGHWNSRDRHGYDHTYHEGNMGGTYERLNREGRDYRNSNRQVYDRNRDRSNYYDRDSHSGHQHNVWADRAISREQRGRIPDHDFSDPNYPDNREKYERRGEQDRYFGSGDYDRRSRHNDRDYSEGRSYSGNYGPIAGSRYSGGRGHTEDWYSSGHRRDELNRYY